jgi:hypothetical protein
MSTYSIHSPIRRHHAAAAHAAQRQPNVAVIIGVCLAVAIIALIFLAAGPASTAHVTHIGHGAAVATTGDTVTVASTGAVPHPAVSGTVPTRSWRETLRGRALSTSNATGQ